MPGPRFGKVKPVYVLTGPATFSGAEQLAYDLQQLGRARVIGERTRGGANAREAFVVHPHLEATISVAAAVSPVTGTNWEGTGVTPDVEVSADEARDLEELPGGAPRVTPRLPAAKEAGEDGGGDIR